MGVSESVVATFSRRKISILGNLWAHCESGKNLAKMRR